jgi:hypothetical protein
LSRSAVRFTRRRKGAKIWQVRRLLCVFA